jgi:hypothetical protein
MKAHLLMACLLIAFSVQAQFSVENYFNDPVSFSYEVCHTRIEKKKEVKSCYVYKYVVRIKGAQFRVTTITKNPNGNEINANMASYVEGNLSSIFFITSKVEKLVLSPGETSTPADIYYLTLREKSGEPWFSDVSEFFGTKGTSDVRMYFPSAKAAEEAKTLLQTYAEMQLRQNDAWSYQVLQDIPDSKCDAKGSRYVSKNYGYTLCLESNETAEELSYSKLNYNYLKDFTRVKGYSDLPFYIFSIDYKTEPDSILVFNKTEEEFFDKMGAANIVKKEIYVDKYTAPDTPGSHGTYVRGYTVTLKNEAEVNIIFNYKLGGNSRFDALCFAYMAPTGLEGAGYSFRNSALLSECVVLTFK